MCSEWLPRTRWAKGPSLRANRLKPKTCLVCLPHLLQFFRPFFQIYINFSGVAEPPGKPVVESVDTKEMTLTWAKPTRDGGRPVEGYILEQFDPETEKWTKVTPKIIKDEKFTLKDLRPYKPCKFRVSAVNEAGTGRPSPASDSAELNCKPA